MHQCCEPAGLANSLRPLESQHAATPEFLVVYGGYSADAPTSEINSCEVFRKILSGDYGVTHQADAINAIPCLRVDPVRHWIVGVVVGIG